MAAKKGLGKGLDSLLIDKTVKKEEKENVSRETLVNINLVEPNSLQPRKKFDDDALQELADSIKVHGVIQPLIVQKKGHIYEIIAGERRWRASRLAGLKEVPVIIKDYSEQEIFEIALIENIQREDLNPIEEALAYLRLSEEYNLKQEEIAERVSKSRVAVTNSLRLLKLDKRVQQMLIDEMISGGHARALLSLGNGDMQFEVANRIFDEKLNVRDTEKLVKKLLADKPIQEVAVSDESTAIYRDIEEKLKTVLGSKVAIHRKKDNKGKIEIEYYSADELERLIEILTGSN